MLSTEEAARAVSWQPEATQITRARTERREAGKRP